MIGWLRRRVERLQDDFWTAFDPNACPDCLGEGITTGPPDRNGHEWPELCSRCDGDGKREQQ